MRLKTALSNIALMIFSLAIAFAIGEIVVRLLYKDVTVLFPRYHTDYQYGRYTIRGTRPDAEFWHTSIDGSWQFVTNSKGFRNIKEFTYNKPVNTFRVLSLGDSHTQGHEVRQDFTFSAILERFLNQHKPFAEVINTGTSGFSNAEELVLLENEGLKYNPDIVVLAFFANDFEDNMKSGLFGLDSNNRLIEKKYEHIPGVHIQNFIYSIPLVQWLSENSYFYSLFFNSTWKYFKLKFAEQTAMQANANNNTHTAGAGGFEFAVSTSATYSDYQIDLAAALIERMQRFCANKSIRFIVVDIPIMPSLYHFTSSMPAALRARLNKAHIEYITSESLLQKFNGAAEMHVPHGYNHISEFTHTLIAQELGHRILLSSITAKQ
ncbi:MAG: hypothetical protein A2W25_03595 [candidate division Zixibacteria bacterium RBG_16_53_22]|nr:MAG: hypothetical protein A2W25_03595 [candidate division Zixibacteria bacterium RBG_16_53_22]